MIYFLQAPNGGPIKIGSSIRLAQRLLSHQAERKTKLLILGVADGGIEREREAQRQFAHSRYEAYRSLEWFHPTPDLLAYIAQNTRPWTEEDDSAPIRPPNADTHRPMPRDAKGFRLQVSPDVRDRLNLAAAKQGLSMTALIRHVVFDWIDQAEPPDGLSQPRTK